jgi:hypothetical protein
LLSLCGNLLTHSNPEAASVLIAKCIGNAIKASWYVTKKQIYEDLEVLIFADHNTEGFDPKFTNEGTPLEGMFADKAPLAATGTKKLARKSSSP